LGLLGETGRWEAVSPPRHSQGGVISQSTSDRGYIHKAKYVAGS
jgi:hypothetical protein